MNGIFVMYFEILNCNTSIINVCPNDFCKYYYDTHNQSEFEFKHKIIILLKKIFKR
jgi:hypothetical protein